MAQTDYYQVLGVTSDASLADLRAAYVRLIRQHHPDTAGELPNRLQEIQQAYRCLTDTSSRAEHDELMYEARRLHLAQKRSVRRRLNRYDLRHPQSPSAANPFRRSSWLLLGTAIMLLTIVTVAAILID